MASKPVWPWFAAVAVAVGLVTVTHGQHGSHGRSPAGARPSAAGSAATPSGPAPSRSATADPNNPALYAAAVVRYARQAGIHPQLLMAILYNESYKPHDPAFERAWQRLKPDAAFGVANMHRAAFDETKQHRSFARRTWEDLPGDPDLAIEAAAWYLHDLARQLPAHPTGTYTTDQLLALGYNTGAGNMRTFAAGTAAGPQARSYLTTLHDNWARAATALGPASAR